MFANCARMSNLKGAVKSFVSCFCNDLLNKISLDLLLSKIVLGTDDDGEGSLEGFSCCSVGLTTSYYLRYDFPNWLAPVEAGPLSIQ